MKASPQKRKAAPNKPESQVPKADLGTRVVELLEAPRAQCGIPLLVVAATFILGIWTFDAKLSLSGDNAEFITLARSLAQGEGLLHINSPDPQPATKYPFGFPLLLAPLAWAFPGDWVPMKVWVLVLFALGMGVLYQLAKERMGVLPGLGGGDAERCARQELFDAWTDRRSLRPAVAALRTPSHVRSALFDLFAFGAVACRTRPRARGPQGKLVARRRVRLHHLGVLHPHSWDRASGGCGGLSVAPTRFSAVFALWRRGVCLLAAVDLAQSGGGRQRSVYIKQLFMVNPYHPERGLLDLGGFVERFIGHAYRYLTRELPNTLVPFFDGTGTILHPAPLLLIALAVAATVLCIKRGEHLLLLLYAAFFMGIVLLWPWPGDRFLVPIVPVLVLLGVWVVLQIRDRLAGGNVGKLVVWGCFLACVIGQVGGVKRLADYAAADYPPPWLRYYQAGQWLKANAPEDAIVLCRKGYWMYIVSGRRCVGFPFDEPAKVLAHMEREKVEYVVLESLGFSQTGQYLYPAIKEYESRFQVVWHDQPVPTYVLRFLKQ